jgi:O-antigen ligase
MNKKFIEILIVCILIFAGIWMATSFVSLHEQLQIFGLIAILALAIISIVFRKVPLDCKIICALILGYAFAGKGFAYITPVEPLYIGEIVWIIGMLGYIYRLSKGAPILPSWLHIMIVLWMITVGLYLLHGYPIYGNLAIRDSAIGYYAMFAFYAYAVFVRNDIDRFFGYILKAAILFACIGLILVLTGAYEKIISLSPIIKLYFNPHPDAFLPLVAAGGMYCLLEGIRNKSILRILAGIVIVLLLFTTKTAGIFCFFILMAYLIVFGRRTDLIITSAVACVLAVIGIGILFTIDSYELNKLILNNEHLDSFNAGGTTAVKSSNTTDWRIAWWQTIYEDTMQESPIFGLGLGGDITSHFLQSYMRIDLNAPETGNIVRYPHNVILTIFGRMGIVGLLVFLAFLASLSRVLIKSIRLQINDTSDAGKYTLLAQLIVIAGIANGLVQATYEIPFGAITHWFCIGYVMAYWQKKRKKSAVELGSPTSERRIK